MVPLKDFVWICAKSKRLIGDQNVTSEVDLLTQQDSQPNYREACQLHGGFPCYWKNRKCKSTCEISDMTQFDDTFMMELMY